MLFCWGVFFLPAKVRAQGPPITTDKPIMLGSKSVILKTLTEIRSTKEGTFVNAPLMVHYLPTSNSLVAIHIPYITYNFSNPEREDGSNLGDVQLLAKYQFYKKDGKGKTFRTVVKALHTFPTGEDINIMGMGLGVHQTYLGVVAGYESLQLGVSNELGYNQVFDKDFDELRYKLGFGVPLLKPTYPVKKVNLYFEYQSSWLVNRDEVLLLYAQGLQYARGRFTIEASIQFPLYQNLPDDQRWNRSLFLGTRYIF